MRVTLDGLPERYAPGEAYSLTVRLEAPALRRGGFQLAVRYLAGRREGAQAGDVRAEGPRAEVVAASTDSGGTRTPVRYARHTLDGSVAADGADAAGAGDRDEITWTVTWIAPSSRGAKGPRAVAVDVSANASNDDASAFGDRIVTERFVVPGPAPKAGRADPGDRGSAFDRRNRL